MESEDGRKVEEVEAARRKIEDGGWRMRMEDEDEAEEEAEAEEKRKRKRKIGDVEA